MISVHSGIKNDFKKGWGWIGGWWACVLEDYKRCYAYQRLIATITVTDVVISDYFRLFETISVLKIPITTPTATWRRC